MSKIIALDAGHGYYTPGKRCLDGTKEWFLNDRIMDMVEKNLRENYDCTVFRMDDTTGKKDISLANRVRAANNAGADFYLSMHHNAARTAGDFVGGTVVYYASDTEERQKQAMALYNAIQSRTHLPINTKRAKTVFQRLYVIYHTKCASLLVENGFMNSTIDMPVILSEEHARKTAEGVVAFLVEQLCLEPLKVAVRVDMPKRAACYNAYTGPKTTLTDALNSLGIDSSYAFRKRIAAANGIGGYYGSYAQNIQMYNLLVAGMLKKV